MENNPSLSQKAKRIILGRSRNPQEQQIFHKLSLIAFFAWVGLGADGLSSSCYGPQEAFLALGQHTYLSVFVAIASFLTILIISASYSQIVELFPHGGGGYLVASRLLSPTLGMVSGCALLIDYVLTITVSIASGADALFSILPLEWHSYRMLLAVGGILFMTILNMRGIKESILPLVPIFLTFIVTHVFIILYALCTHFPELPQMAVSTSADMHKTLSEVGFWGMIFLVLRAYSMGAGTYTGIEAVSNGIPVLREPKAKTAKQTMRYMALSLGFTASGLILAYLFYNVSSQPGKTFNAILFETATLSWGKHVGITFVSIALFSEAALLFVAAQAGFLDGPRVLANMAKDRWFPGRFAALSDRLVVQNGIFIMGVLAAVLMVVSRGSVAFLVILYSINVFITFVLSQSGMVRHWWNNRTQLKNWKRKLLVNGIGLILCVFILVSMVFMKFHEGGWITIFITAALVLLAVLIKRHYIRIAKLLRRLNNLVSAVEVSEPAGQKEGIKEVAADPSAKTAVLLVSGFNGMGLHTLFGIIRLFPGVFKNFIFLEVGVVDAGNFRGVQEMSHLKAETTSDLSRYVKFMQKEGFYAEGISSLGVDVIDEIEQVAPEIIQRFPNTVFFGGQLIFPKDSFVTRFLHNYTVFALQKKLYRQGMPFVILPIRVES